MINTLSKIFQHRAQVCKNAVKQHIYMQFNSHLVLRSRTVSLPALQKTYNANFEHGCPEGPVHYLLARDTDSLSVTFLFFFFFSVAFIRE